MVVYSPLTTTQLTILATNLRHWKKKTKASQLLATILNDILKEQAHLFVSFPKLLACRQNLVLHSF